MTRPRCLNCGKPLRRFRYRDTEHNVGKGREYGDYGDNHFCGLTCGYRWSIAMLARDSPLSVRLHEAMNRIMEKREGEAK